MIELTMERVRFSKEKLGGDERPALENSILHFAALPRLNNVNIRRRNT